MKIIYFTVIAVFLSLTGCAQQDKYNGGFEKVNKLGSPEGWITSMNQSTAYAVKIDSLIRKSGKYSLSISQIKEGAVFEGASYTIPYTFKGKEIELRGQLRLQNVTGGYAGLWLQTIGPNGPLSMDYMKDQKLSGTKDWQEYSIKIPYDELSASKINFGAVLFGNGKLWVDDLRLFIDGRPIEGIPTRQISNANLPSGSSSIYRPTIDTILLNRTQIKNLSLLCQVWGFVKYNLPSASSGKYNIDAELLKIIPKIINVKNQNVYNGILEGWVDKFQKPTSCDTCLIEEKANTYIKPDYGDIFKPGIFPKRLRDKLSYILRNRVMLKNHYVDMAKNVNNPIFTNEQKYEEMIYPDVSYRLLALFRYWNVIQYFYPYKHLLTTEWSRVLPKYIPDFVKAANKTEYVTSILKLVGTIHDSHAQILTYSSALEEYRGNFIVPIKAKFIEGKLIVTGFYPAETSVKEGIKLGDVIIEINNHPIKELLNKFMPLTPGSNYTAQLRDIVNSFLLRTTQPNIDFKITRNGVTQTLKVKTVNFIKAISSEKLYGDKVEYKVLDGNIGYLFAGKYRNTDLSKIKETFNKTKALIVDMRCYPSDFMPYSFGSFIKVGKNNFVKFTSTSFKYPGRYKITTPPGPEGLGEYKGKVIILVNEETQSQAEFTTMAFQSSKNVKVVGSTTAGADGNVSDFYLPGGIGTRMSGLGILYPDGSETQQKGIKIDYFVKPTIKGFIENRDEILEKAIQLVNE